MDECKSCKQFEGCGIRRMYEVLVDIATRSDIGQEAWYEVRARVAFERRSQVCEGYLENKEG